LPAFAEAKLGFAQAGTGMTRKESLVSQSTGQWLLDYRDHQACARAGDLPSPADPAFAAEAAASAELAAGFAKAGAGPGCPAMTRKGDALINLSLPPAFAEAKPLRLRAGRLMGKVASAVRSRREVR
jgi:hypothetical protein